MWTIIELFNSLGLIVFSFLKDVTEEEIDKNVYSLKEFEWFQVMLKNESYEKLITEDTDVRFVIGKLNMEKMNKTAYHDKSKAKIAKVLVQKTKAH
ncbi:hypothetical protein BBI11_04125 [Planococcus maritimus]|uniref:hypothetical protein n=1 Tax=Planococcus maritimus TaxID=192421 RepID=UPI00080F1A5E|nr:hypothetical protein [Planococcus maritimus]ANU16291.1 hypothetical protein BBI11_04125 [Planococcus maritimus]